MKTESDNAAHAVPLHRFVGRRVRLKDKLPLLGWTVSTRNRLRGVVVADKNYSTAVVRISADESWNGQETEGDHAKTDLTLLVPPND
jgi:hypothetical protein